MGITIPQGWLFLYNSLILTGILVTNIVVIIRCMILDARERKRLHALPPPPPEAQ